MKAMNKKIAGRISFYMLLSGFIILAALMFLSAAAKEHPIHPPQIIAAVLVCGALLMVAGGIGIILYDSN